jgi:DNA-binding GntR family transcriptional regulator
MPTNGAVRTAELEVASIAHHAYLELKQRIVSLDFAPGSTIREVDLQQQLGLGRTPLRDALQRLAHDGLLRIYPRRAIVVPKLGLAEVRQLFEARSAVEPAAAALAAERLTPADAQTLEALATRLAGMRDQPDVDGFLQADQAFHRAVAGFCRNALLTEYIDHLQTLNLWLWNMYFDSHPVRRADLFAHEPIVDALLRANARSAEVAMREHITGSKEQLLAGL